MRAPGRRPAAPGPADDDQSAALDGYFLGHPASRALFEPLRAAIASLGDCGLKVTRSQVSFRRRRAFAWAWIPGKALRRPAAPLVLTLALRHRDPSPRWKQVVEPYPGRFTHHLELSAPEDLDAELRAWLREAWEGAG